jgi:putative aldouronate transport system permease protein
MWCDMMKYKGKTVSGPGMFLKQWDLQIMVIPAIICIIIFAYIPMWGILFAFKDYDIFRGFLSSKWVDFS